MLVRTNAIYQEIPARQDELGNDNGRTRGLITGRNLAHANRSVLERAFIGADLRRNRVELISPTIKQSAYLAGVCVPYVAAAIAIADDETARVAVLTGDISLLDAARVAAPETLAEHFSRTSPAEWLEAARVIGPSLVWDHMISPLI